MSEYKKNIKTSYEKFENNSIKGFVLGFSAIGEHEINQDSYGYRIFPDKFKLAIADGLGSSKYGDIGSQMAVEVILENDWFGEQDFINIYNNWKEKLGNENLLDYDTTLKYICVDDHEIVFTSVGDGVIYIESDEDSYVFVTDDEFINETDSLCSVTTNNSNYYNKMSYENSTLVVMYTDGIDQFFDKEKLTAFSIELKKMYKEEADLEGSIIDWIKSWEDKNYYDDKTMIVFYAERMPNDFKQI